LSCNICHCKLFINFEDLLNYKFDLVRKIGWKMGSNNRVLALVTNCLYWRIYWEGVRYSQRYFTFTRDLFNSIQIEKNVSLFYMCLQNQLLLPFLLTNIKSIRNFIQFLFLVVVIEILSFFRFVIRSIRVAWLISWLNFL
jgi:hypothetical protein